MSRKKKKIISENDYISALAISQKMAKIDRDLSKYIIEKILVKHSEERPSMYVSKKAIAEADSKSIILNLCNHGKYRTRNKGIKLRWEHSNVTGVLAEELLNGGNPKSILPRNIVSVITKDEDRRLSKKNKSKRDPDFIVTYLKVGIELIEYQEYLQLKNETCS